MLYNYSRRTQRIVMSTISLHTHTHTHTHTQYSHTYTLDLHSAIYTFPYMIIVTRLVYVYIEAFDNPIVKTS